MSSLSKFAIAIFLIGQAVWAQSASSPVDATIRVTANLVQVDATVVDGKGQPVKNLTKEDFEVLQDGKPRAITAFSLIELASQPPAQPLKAAPQGNRPISRDKVRRSVAIIVDDIQVTWNGLLDIRYALRNYVDKQIEDGDLVSVSFTGTDIGALAAFSNNRSALMNAVNRIDLNTMGMRNGISNGSVQFQQLSLTPLLRVIDAMEGMPGRKSILYFSPGVNPKTSAIMLQNVAAKANRVGVTIYSIDPRGFQMFFEGTASRPAAAPAEDAVSPTATAIAAARTASDTPVFDEARSPIDAYGLTQQSLMQLSHDTGGLYFGERNNLGKLLQNAMEDQGAYYLLGYSPGEDSFDRKYHKIEVRVKVKGLQVRSRAGYMGDPPSKPSQQENGSGLLNALVSPFQATSIHTRLAAVFSAGGKEGMLRALVNVDGRDLQFEKLADGTYQANLQFLMTLFDANGMASEQSAKGFILDLTAEGWKHVGEAGVSYMIPYPVKKPGAYQLRLAVRDALSGDLGSTSQLIEVPDLDKNRMSLSGLLLTAPPEEANPHPLSTPAVRTFLRGHDAAWMMEVYHPRAKGKGAPKLQWNGRIYRDGVVVRDLPLSPVKTQQMLTGDRDVLVQGTFKLDPSLEPGDYFLQLNIGEEGSPPKDFVSQTADFVVLP